MEDSVKILVATDILSTVTPQVLELNAARAYQQLVVTGPASLIVKEILSPIAVKPDDVAAQSLLAGLWLWHDWLDESHRIAQQLQTPEGSFWHAIIHRREGDFSNSKYWFARCRNHPAFADIAAQLPAVMMGHRGPREADRLTRNGWDPTALVDLAEVLHDQPDAPGYSLAVAVQRLEWQALFAWCAKNSTR